jgi:O-antigen ligase
VAAKATIHPSLIAGAVAASALALGALAGIDPRLGVFAAAGLAFVALVMSNLTLGLCLFTLIAFVDALPTAAGSALSLQKAAGLVLVGSWLGTVAVQRRSLRTFLGAHPAISYTLVAFLVWAGVSAVWAQYVPAAETAVIRYCLSIVLALIVFSAVQTRRDALWVLKAFVAGAALSAAYGIIAGGTTEAVNTSSGVSRITGTSGDPNEFAAMLVVGMVLAGALAFSRERMLVRWAAIGAIGLCTLGILLTVSRGGLVALGAALLMAIVAGGRWRLPMAVVAVVVAGATIGYFTTYAPPQAEERILDTAGGGSGREDLWTVAWRMFKDRPVGGVGAGNYPIAAIDYLLQPGLIVRDEFIIDTPKPPHNVYLSVLAELGVVGLALFMIVLGFAVASVLRAARLFERAGDTEMEIYARALCVAFVGLLTADFFLSEPFGKQLWLLIGLGPALLAVARRSERDPAESAAGNGRGLELAPSTAL